MSATGSTATDAQSTTDDVPARTRRAREEDIEVEAVDEGDNSVTVTVSNDDNTSTYDVMVGKEYGMSLGCTCRDWQFRARRDNSSCDAHEGCKHMRAVAAEMPDGDLFTVVESLTDDGVDDAVIREMVDAPAHRVETAIKTAREGTAAALDGLAE